MDRGVREARRVFDFRQSKQLVGTGRDFVPVKRHAEESFVPLDTAVEITDCQGHVCDGGKSGTGASS